MNKRIENLFEQALDAAVPETWTRLDMDQVKRLCDKFAELTIRECLEVAHQEHKNALEFDWDNDDTAQTIRDSISEHFGVEE
jgi:hypothetical protein